MTGQAVKYISFSSVPIYVYFKLLRANEHNLEQQVHYIIGVRVDRNDHYQGASIWLLLSGIGTGGDPCGRPGLLDLKREALIVGLLIW